MEQETLKRRLIILGVLILALALVLFLLTRKKTDTGAQVAGSGFNLLETIYDLRTPLGVTADADDNIYVSDTGNSRINVYDKNGTFQYTLDNIQDENGQSITFPSPYGLAVDNGSDKLYVCDYTVRVLNKTGKYLYDLTIPKGIVSPPKKGEGSIRPNEVAVYQDRVYVTGRDGIYIWDDNGKYVDHWGTRGKAVGQYDFPNGVAVDPQNGNLYVADTNNWRIVALTPDGKVRWTLGNQESANVQSPFHLVRSIAVGPDGLIYISDAPDRIVVLDQDGKLKSIIGERGTGDATLNFPEGIFVSDSNRLYFADRENNRVQVWQLNSNLPSPSGPDVDKFAKAKKDEKPESQNKPDKPGNNDTTGRTT